MKHRHKGVPERQLPAGPGARRLSGWRLWRLRLLALVAVPLVFLALTELALRLSGFGHPTAFLLPSTNHGRATFVQNNQFGWRFFGKRMSRAPDPISILRDKPRDTIRIFVFGESAAFGDPQPAFGLPRVLEATLSLRHPDMKFEVVNAAMTAINSHVILPIAHDCARAGGDIWVIYMGNNEVVGPFGAGTVFGSQGLPLPLIRATLALKTTRLGQLIDAARELWQKAPADKSEWGGMLMFVDQQVRADDPRMAGVYRNFERNLSDIVRTGHDSGAGVVVSTVAVNLKDFAPFASQHRTDLSGPEKEKWDDLDRLGIQAQAAGRTSEAVAQFQAAGQLDDASAELQFRLGRGLLAMGDAPKAQKALIAARDLDTLRFRCDSRMNELARKAATGREAERILLADAERSFAANSPDGAPGWDLFYEHVHLTFEGNCLLARTLVEQIEKLLPKNSSSGNPAWPSVADCARRLGRTDRDLRPALTDILGRLIDPPFTEQINHDEQMQHLTSELRKLVAPNKAESLAHALEVARSAVEVSPEDPQLYQQLSTLEQAAGRQAEAEAAARRAVDLLPSSSEDWSQLGFTFVQEKKYEDALNAYQRAFDLNPQDVWPLQNLAMSLTKLGRNSEAMREYKRALAITPRFGLAWLGLGQLLESMGRKDEAADCYQKALQNRIHRAPEMATLARFCMSRGWFEAASTNYSDAIKLDPSDPALPVEAGQAHFLFGMELGKSGQAAPAAREFQEAVRLMPEVVEARLNLGIALFREEQWNESLHEFEQVAARSPTNALAQHYLEILHKRAPQQELQ
jgi:tetratricopeptide (TPR) repeat protein